MWTFLGRDTAVGQVTQHGSHSKLSLKKKKILLSSYLVLRMRATLIYLHQAMHDNVQTFH